MAGIGIEPITLELQSNALPFELPNLAINILL